MATSTAKAPNGAKTTTAPSSANGSTTERLSPQDTRLLKLVRTNIRPIVAGVLAMASRSGEERDYARMNEGQTLASQLATLGGLTSATAGAPSAPATMTAAAGAGAH